MRHLLVTVLVLTLAGCSVSRTAAPTTTTTATTTTTTMTTTTTTTTTEAAPTTASDGTNLLACGDGVCQVLVKPGDVVVARGESLAIYSMTSTDVTIQISGGMLGALNGEITINDSVTVAITPIDTTSAILTFS